MIDSLKNVCDAVSACVAIGAWALTLDIPTAAALASLVYTVVRFGEWAYLKIRG